MPYLSLQTNATPSAEEQAAFLEEASEIVSRVLGKSRIYIMAGAQTGLVMSFAGHDEPCGFMELKALNFSPEHSTALAQALSQAASSHLAISPSRLFLRFVDTARGHWAMGEKIF
ncbi:phenylpyruvate tautomerase MIF-related protein [Roseibacillus ishigakijimensis]|uniref:L-dopachrome isomerase n=1 Tax=Roseibacillus ishigakijimensis TaxID=454146 RepID=A0A934VMV2_9BACT|nr:phenylpyruvate tautomerase MIF-related protein [Roseibacillus ishigakijimensis]MBK1834350.1 hypothetical protein [Roseibacillus ishigakijimensis]